MKRYYFSLLVLLLFSIGKGHAQCVDATALPSSFQPLAGQQVQIYHGFGVGYEPDWEYTVNFGNGTSSLGTGLPSHRILGIVTYASPGLYLVEVDVEDPNEMCTDSYSFYIQVIAPAGTCEASDIMPYDYINCIEEDVEFAVDLHTDIDNINFSLDHIEWNMGDGNVIITTTNTLTYQYASEGFYYVTAKVVVEDLSDNTLCKRYAHAEFLGPGSVIMYNDYAMVRIYNADPYFSMDPVNPIFMDDVIFTYTGNPTLWTTLDQDLWEYIFYFDGVPVASAGNAPVNGSVLYTAIDISVGTHTAELFMVWKEESNQLCPQSYEIVFSVPEESCDTCNSFKPTPGQRYWISAWVQDDFASQVPTYGAVSITLDFVTTSGTTTATFESAGEIIDGWQRIAGEFTIPSGTLDLAVNLNAGTNTTYFDDIRIHPFNGSMKSYVYDGDTFWLVAELDDNNYATIYEYDAEGGLVRIKKETSGGIVTIQETRSNTVKIATP